MQSNGTSTQRISALSLAVLAATVAASLAMSGCRSTSPRHEYAPVVSTPLDLDPTERIELSRWWTNGQQLLRLDAAGSYTLYPGTNRYHAPDERGRWSQPSYAHLVFQRYATRQTEPRRIPLSRINNELALHVPFAEPMFAITRPPQVLEDRLLGTWESTSGALRLDGSMRYTYSPHKPEGQGPVMLVGHRGMWQIQGDRVALHPDAPNIPVVLMSIDSTNSPELLESADGKFLFTRKVEE